MSGKITPDHLDRGAVVYIRQSTAAQVLGNLESQRRQYALADAARAAGFTPIAVIDDDLGRSGSGAVGRPGFEKLVASVCAGSVGAVYCLEASRLARNGRCHCGWGTGRRPAVASSLRHSSNAAVSV